MTAELHGCNSPESVDKSSLGSQKVGTSERKTAAARVSALRRAPHVDPLVLARAENDLAQIRLMEALADAEEARKLLAESRAKILTLLPPPPSYNEVRARQMRDRRARIKAAEAAAAEKTTSAPKRARKDRTAA